MANGRTSDALDAHDKHKLTKVCEMWRHAGLIAIMQAEGFYDELLKKWIGNRKFTQQNKILWFENYDS